MKTRRPLLFWILATASLLGCTMLRAALPIATPQVAASLTATPSILAPAAATQAPAPQPSATPGVTPAVPSFRFAYTSDSRDGYATLAALSRQMAADSPVFAVFGGDLCATFDLACIRDTWMPAMDGTAPGSAAEPNDGMLGRTFVLRGNHDSGSLSDWQGLWDFTSMGQGVGVSNYSAETSDASYSFDYGNSHFALLDNPGGDIDTLTDAQIAWLDADLTAAEQRGMLHEFLFTHGPIYGVTTQHGSAKPSAALKAVLDKHPISAAFAGHEHVTQYTHVTASIDPGIVSIQEFTIGRAGAPAYAVVKHNDWHADENAFADIAVQGRQFTVTICSGSGSVLFSKTFTAGQ